MATPAGKRGLHLFGLLAQHAKANSENFLTDSFVVLLSSLLDGDRNNGLALLCDIFGHPFDTLGEMGFLIRPWSIESIPDFVITTPNILIVVEVKEESKVDKKQLRAHRERFKDQCHKLILLSKYPESDCQGLVDKHLYWFDIYDRLYEVQQSIKDSISAFLLDDFLNFLRQKGLFMDKIEKEYKKGVCSLGNLLKMVQLSLSRIGPGCSRIVTDEDIYLVPTDKSNKFYCGISFADPNWLWLWLDKNSLRKNVNVDQKYYPEEVSEDGKTYLELSFEINDHFIRKNREEQLEAISDLLKKWYSYALLKKKL